ncbi:protachykinin-1 [Osmerus mordax]|uniref:Tachykinin 4b n=1 Tax=Osmerus mordax TaxID=8014 RepID=I4IYA5_OSMMO|nr:TPA_inf: tachykinin 4b [Osmerus mordax]
MEIWKLQLVVLTLFAMVYTYEGLSFSVDKEHWISKNWQDEPLEERLASQVANLIKRSKSRQFYGLMGKRSDMKQPIKVYRRRNKGDMFVGLMGRRALGKDSLTTITPAETSTINYVSEDSHKQQDSQEEWDKLQYY